MLRKLNIKGFIFIIVSILLAVLSVFCWFKSKEYSNSPEKQQALKEISKLTKEYNEAKESYEFQKAIFDYYGMQIHYALDDEKKALENYERQINEQRSIIDYFSKKTQSNKSFSVIYISCSAVLLTTGIVVILKRKKKLNDSFCEESIIEENISKGEENV